MAPTSRPKGKVTLLPDSSAGSTSTPQPTAEQAGTTQTPSPRSLSPTQQITISRTDLAKLIAEQVALALAVHETRNTQSPLEQQYERRDTVISSVEPLTGQGTRYRDGPMRGTDAQELSDGQDPTFEAWRLQVLARFRDDSD
jgi:hypothetical protein